MRPKRKAAEKAVDQESTSPKKAKQESPKKSPKKESEKATKKGPLEVGDVFDGDDFEVETHDGETIKFSSIYKDNGAVLFFYPKANTPGILEQLYLVGDDTGCTTQACGFRDNFELFEKKGYKVFGMSADNPTSQNNWKNKHKFPYALLSDRSKDRKVLKALGVNKAPSSITRSHLIFGKGGVLEQVKYAVSPKDSVATAVEFCS